jgi:hypothetical protein
MTRALTTTNANILALLPINHGSTSVIDLCRKFGAERCLNKICHQINRTAITCLEADDIIRSQNRHGRDKSNTSFQFNVEWSSSSIYSHIGRRRRLIELLSILTLIVAVLIIVSYRYNTWLSSFLIVESDLLHIDQTILATSKSNRFESCISSTRITLDYWWAYSWWIRCNRRRTSKWQEHVTCTCPIWK